MIKIITIGLILLINLSVFSQENNNNKFAFSLFGGLSYPITPSSFKYRYDSGISYGGYLAYKASKDIYLALDIANYSNTNITNFSLNFISISKGSKKFYNTYFSGGIGISNLSETDNKFTLNGGIGLEILLLPNAFIFFESKYYHLLKSDEKTGFLPLRIGFIIK